MKKFSNDSKYGIFLTVGLILIVIVIFGLLGFLGFDIYQKYYNNKQVSKALTDFEDSISTDDDNRGENVPDTGEIIDPYASLETVATNTGSGTTRPKLGGYEILGTIEIPKTSIKYPILAEVTTKSLKLSVAKLYGVNLNQVGNVVIAGHNYRNGTFFGRNSQLKNGDKVYITDETGNRIEYIIYNVYVAPESEFSYATRDTNGLREISLTTCTDDSKARTIIWAKENI